VLIDSQHAVVGPHVPQLQALLPTGERPDGIEPPHPTVGSNDGAGRDMDRAVSAAVLGRRA
jgi:hypothetical protein